VEALKTSFTGALQMIPFKSHLSTYCWNKENKMVTSPNMQFFFQLTAGTEKPVWR
jgi:hypothetical protein